MWLDVSGMCPDVSGMLCNSSRGNLVVSNPNAL
jgi:hypothetical protein